MELALLACAAQRDALEITSGGARSRGAEKGQNVGATHAVFCGDAVHKLAHCGADGIVITDSVPVHEPLPERFQSRSVAGLLARAIKAIHNSESVSALFEKV